MTGQITRLVTRQTYRFPCPWIINVKNVFQMEYANWNYYQANVISFTKHNKQFLEQALQGFELDDVTINSTLQQLTLHCTSQELSSNNGEREKKKFDINSINEDFVNWIFYPHLLQSGKNILMLTRKPSISICLVNALVMLNEKYSFNLMELGRYILTGKNRI